MAYISYIGHRYILGLVIELVEAQIKFFGFFIFHSFWFSSLIYRFNSTPICNRIPEFNIIIINFYVENYGMKFCEHNFTSSSKPQKSL